MRALLSLVALVAAPLALPSVAQDARLTGRFTLDRRASDDVVGIGLRAMRLPAAMRPLARTARGRAMVARLAPPTVTIRQDARGAVTIEGERTRTFTPGGPPVVEPVERGSGTVALHGAWDGPRFVVSWAGSAGTSSDTYSIDPQGRLVVQRHLVMTVERDGQRRTTPLNVRLVYTRR